MEKYRKHRDVYKPKCTYSGDFYIHETSFIIHGYEFGDMKVSQDDREIPKSWLNKLMEL